jgi:putative oxidoreductase
MSISSLPPVPAQAGLRHRLPHRLLALRDGVSAWISHDLLALGARAALAGVFFLSGRTKVVGLLSVTDAAVSLFEDEYRLPLLPPDVAAHLATYAEHLFPVLLALGLGTRLSAAALLGMTLVIQLFVYPAAWPTHLSWAMLLLYLVGRGGGRWALDHLFEARRAAPRA